jgi:hypothetical protein
MKNVYFFNLQAALSKSRVEFEAAVRLALIEGVANLTPTQIRNAFFPELTGAEFPVAIDLSRVG